MVKDTPDTFANLVIMNTALPAPGLDLGDNNEGDEKMTLTRRIQGVGRSLSFLIEKCAKTGDVFFQVLPFLLWRFSVLLVGTNLPISKLMGFAFQKNNVPAEVLEAYSAPFPSVLFKAGAARWPLLVPLLKDDPVTAHMAAARNCLKTWRKPVLVMFGDSDPITRTAESLFLNLVPHSKAGFTSSSCNGVSKGLLCSYF